MGLIDAHDMAEDEYYRGHDEGWTTGWATLAQGLAKAYAGASSPERRWRIVAERGYIDFELHFDITEGWSWSAEYHDGIPSMPDGLPNVFGEWESDLTFSEWVYAYADSLRILDTIANG